MEYIDRIKALIAITREFLYKKMCGNIFGLDIIKAKTKNPEYSYYKNAMNKFLNIINGLTENCAFFKGIRQFNSIILTDEFTKTKYYSGSILDVKDIQIELFKYAGQFCIIQEGIPNLYGSYWSCARTVFLNPDTIFGKYYRRDNIKNKENIVERATSCTLFVIFHEISGHLKTHVNNETDSPGQAYVNEQYISIPQPDSGYLFEYIMAGNIISCKHFLDSSISEELLDEKLYLGDNFDELKSKLSKINKVLSPMNTPIPIIPIVTDNKKKIKYSEEQFDDINENYDKKTIDELYIFFSSLDEKEMAKMKDSDAYKFFLSLFDGDGKKI